MTTVPPCPRDADDKLTCTNKVSTHCFSLHYGLHQECNMAEGWLTCLDISGNADAMAICRSNYGIHKDSVWVKDGCEADFVGCFQPGFTDGKVRTRTVECRDLENDYKQCKVEGAKFVKDVDLKIELPSIAQCAKGINYGIFNDSIWVHGGCSGIFDIQFYEDRPGPIETKATSKPTTTTTTRRPPWVPETPKPSTRLPPFVTRAPTSPSSSSHRSVPTTVAAPYHNKTDMVPITFAIVCGVLVALLLILFAALWFCRRNSLIRRCLVENADENKTECEMDEISNAYEEITPVMEPPRIEKPRESDPFIATKTTNNGEQNNNPPLPLPNNYFILEPHSTESPSPRSGTYPPQNTVFYRHSPQSPPFTDANIQPYAHGQIPHYAQGLIQVPEFSQPLTFVQPSAPMGPESSVGVIMPAPVFHSLNRNGAFSSPRGPVVNPNTSLPHNDLSSPVRDDEGYETFVNSLNRSSTSSRPAGSVRSDHYDKIKDYHTGAPSSSPHFDQPQVNIIPHRLSQYSNRSSNSSNKS